MRAVAALLLLLASASVAQADGSYELHAVAGIGQTWVSYPDAGTVWADGPVFEVGVAEPAWPDTTVGVALVYARVSVPPPDWQSYTTADYDQFALAMTLEHHAGRFAFGAELGFDVVSRSFSDPNYSGSSDTGLLLDAGTHVAVDVVTIGRGKLAAVLAGRVAPRLPTNLLSREIPETFATITLGVGYRL